MSSKGPTVAGSDGSDFSHRQKVADHYKIRYQLLICLHLLNNTENNFNVIVLRMFNC